MSGGRARRRLFTGTLLGGVMACTTLAPAQATELPRVMLMTTEGPIVIALDTQHAPRSAGDFLQYVQRGLYDQGAGFYRVVRRDNDHGTPPIEVIQGGLLDENDPRALPPVAHESTRQTGLRHLDGTVSLARGAPGTGGGAAFFICVGPQPGLDAGALRNPDGQGFAALGQVVFGMDTVRRIHAGETDPAQGEAYVQGQMLKQPVRLLWAKEVK